MVFWLNGLCVARCNGSRVRFSRDVFFFFRDVPNEAVSVPYMSSALIDLIPV